MSTLFSIDVGWKVILDDMNLDVARLLSDSNLPFDTFEKTNSKATTEQFFALWDNLETQVKNKDFSLLMGTSVSPEIFNPVLFSAICSDNFEQAMLRLQEFKLLVGPMSLNINKANKQSISYEVLSTQGDILPISYQLTECVFFVYLIQLSTRKKIYPSKITFPNVNYISENTQKYLNTKIVQGDSCVIEFDYEDTQVPFISANHTMWSFFKEQLQAQLLELKASQSFVEKTQTILLKLIPTGQVSIDNVADKLCISKRTLQRKLKDEGVNFQEVVNQLREKLARHYLEQTHLPNAQISFLLGFDDPNSFIRAFSNWVGQSPEMYRRLA